MQRDSIRNSDRKGINCFGGKAFDGYWLGFFIKNMTTNDYKKCNPKQLKNFYHMSKNYSFSGNKTGGDEDMHPSIVDTIVSLGLAHAKIDRSCNTANLPGFKFWHIFFNIYNKIPFNPQTRLSDDDYYVQLFDHMNTNKIFEKTVNRYLKTINKQLDSNHTKIFVWFFKMHFMSVLDSDRLIEYYRYFRGTGISRSNSIFRSASVSENVKSDLNEALGREAKHLDQSILNIVDSFLSDNDSNLINDNELKTLPGNTRELMEILRNITMDNSCNSGSSYDASRGSYVNPAHIPDAPGDEAENGTSSDEEYYDPDAPIPDAPIPDDPAGRTRKRLASTPRRSRMRTLSRNEKTSDESERGTSDDEGDPAVPTSFSPHLHKRTDDKIVNSSTTNKKRQVLRPMSAHMRTQSRSDDGQSSQEENDMSPDDVEFPTADKKRTEPPTSERVITRNPTSRDEKDSLDKFVDEAKTRVAPSPNSWMRYLPNASRRQSIPNASRRQSMNGGSWMTNTSRNKRMYSHENKEVVEFVRCVCNFWLNDPVTREFYKNFLQPLYRDNDHLRGWVRMSEEQMKQLCESKMDGRDHFANNVRFNLRRAIHGDGHILFQSCIPDIPVGTIVHYTSSDRTVKSFKVKDKRDLAYIYQLVYNHELGNYNNDTGYDYPHAHRGVRPSSDIERYQKEHRQEFFNNMAPDAGYYNGQAGGGGYTTKLEISVSNTVLDIEVDYETRCSTPYQSWKNFNHSAWIERILMDNKKSSGQGVDLDSLLRTDIIDENSVRWMWDEKENKYYYTDKNASRVYFDHTLAKKRKNCYDTYLMNENNYNEEKCEEIMSCISADNPTGLYNCLRALSDGNADLFEAAKRDVERTGKHNPVIIKKILSAFGVPKDKAYLASGLDVPCHPRQWIKTLHKNLRERKVAEPIIRQIRSNESLIKYVSALIILCRANHTILNKEKTGARSSGDNKYQTDINGKITRPVHRFNKNDFRNKLLSAVNEDAINTFFHSALNNDWYNNSIFVPSSAIAYVHSGGGNSTHTATNGFGVIYNNIKAHLKRLGLTMHHEDNKAIEKKIKSVDTLNEQLAKCAEMLTNLVRIARAYGITINTDMPVSNIRLKNVLTVNDVNNFLRKHALRIRSYMRNNFNVQHNIYNELLGNVFPTIMDVNCDDEDNNDSDDDTKTVLFGDE